MNGFWLGFYEVCNVLMIVAGIAFFAMIAYIVVTALSLKTTVMRDAKRLYEPPLKSAKSIVATGKGIALQEQVRIKHIGAQFKVMADDVKDAVTEIGGAAKTIHPQDLKNTLSSAQSVLRFASAMLKLVRVSSKQRQ
jgi:hypothetical protein